MPLLQYFVVVGSVLLGLLFVAEAQLGPAKPLNISTNFHGLPAPFKAASTPILTVREGIAPALAQSTVEASPTSEQKVAKLAEKKAKKVRKIVRHNAAGDLFAHSTQTQRQPFGIVW